jgi:catechol 2,3-dioxygenase-like lactoylglutathione lyase family enzyme
MAGTPSLRVTSVTIGAPDPRELAAFYARLLGWTVTVSDPPRPGYPPGDGWAQLRPSSGEGGPTLAEYQPQDDVRVLLDPAGHPFCLYLG